MLSVRLLAGIPALRNVLFADDRPGYCRGGERATGETDHSGASGVYDFATRSLLPFKHWVKEASLRRDSRKGDKPKALIHDISECLLAQYANSEVAEQIQRVPDPDGLLD